MGPADLGREYNSGEGTPDYRKLKLDTYPERYWAADDYTLQLDLDKEEEFKHFKMMWHRFAHDLRDQELFPWMPIGDNDYQVHESRTPGHRHVIVNLSSPLDTVSRIMIQCCFGSDRRRELRNWGRAKKGMKDPVLLRRKD